jgi:ABC-type transport system involved in cytochrome c biogenesis permease subunit
MSSEAIVGIAIALGTGAAFLAYFEPKFYQRLVPVLSVLAFFVFFGLCTYALYTIRARSEVPLGLCFMILLGAAVYFIILSSLADHRLLEQRKKAKSATP